MSLLLASWHLQAGHLFSLLLIWHSLGRWWMHTEKPADTRPLQSFTVFKPRSRPVVKFGKNSAAFHVKWFEYNVEQECCCVKSAGATCWKIFYLGFAGRETGCRFLIRRFSHTATFPLMGPFLFPSFSIKSCFYKSPCKVLKVKPVWWLKLKFRLFGSGVWWKCSKMKSIILPDVNVAL